MVMCLYEGLIEYGKSYRKKTIYKRLINDIQEKHNIYDIKGKYIKKI